MDRKKEIILIRHGESKHNISCEKRIGGWNDSDLTTKGNIQADAVGKYLRDSVSNPTEYVMYCSDLKRARQTAQIISQYLGIKANATPAFREMNFGIANGLLIEQANKIKTKCPENFLDWQMYDESETFGDFYERVHSKFCEISDEKVIIIAHAGSIKAIINNWLLINTSLLGKMSFEIHPCSLSLLTYNEHSERTLSYLNRLVE